MQHFIIPELCQIRALAVLALYSQLFVVTLVVAGGDLSWPVFSLMTLYVQSVALSSAAILCFLRNLIARLAFWVGSTLAIAVVLAVTLVVSAVAEVLLERGSGALMRIAGQLIISGIISVFALRYSYVQQQLRLQENAELQARIQALQSRIRPHFLFNSMNIIASLIPTAPETAEEVVEDLSELFRASLKEAHNQVPLEDELELCRRYLRIEALRLGDRLQLQWDMTALLPGTQVPLLTLQPLLENAIYHGVQPLAEGGTVAVELRYVGDSVVLKIVNPVPPQGYKQTSQGNQMAIQNISNRLKAIYGDAARLETSAGPEVFVTELKLPKTHHGV